MSDERDVFFIQMAEVDTEARDRPMHWETQSMFSFEDRAQAEQVLARAIEPLFKSERAGGMFARERLVRRLRRSRPVERVFRVVSSTELRSEGEDAWGDAEEAAALGAIRLSEEREAGDDDV
jgi:hypothetical protein